MQNMRSTDPGDIVAPELYGWTLLAAANAVDITPFINYKLANDAGFLKLRDYDNFDEYPTTSPLDPRRIHYETQFDQPLLSLDPAHKSVSPFLSFWDYHDAYTSLKTTPTIVAKNLLAKIEESKSLNFMRFICKDITQQAEKSTQRYKDKKQLSQLDGVFVSVKEEVDIQGLETKAGTCFLNDEKPALQDSTLVKKLRKAGAIVVGSTVMNELGWDTFSVNPNTGTPKNPYKKDLYSCGGSSGGCGGSVAAGLFPISIGADGGGSVRIPSAFCGLYGLKTTWSRVSAFGGIPLDPSVGCYGPLAATSDDMALSYALISGPDPKDLNSLHQPPVSLDGYNNTDLSDITVAIIPEWNKSIQDPVIAERLSQMQAFLKNQGARIVEIDVPDLGLTHTAHMITICGEMVNFASRFANHRRSLIPYSRLMYALSCALEARDFIRAQQLRTRMIKRLSHIFHNQNIDLILTPSTAMLSPDIPEKALSYGMVKSKMTVYTMYYAVLANFTGIPAVSIPAGYHNDLPVGMQFMASWWNEALLCRIAKTVEKLSDFERKIPKEHWFASDIL